MYKAMILPAIAGIVLQMLFIMIEHKKQYVPAVILKGSASLIFCVIGWFAKNAASQSFAQWIFAGLVFGMLGDIALNLRFVFPEKGQKIFLGGIVLFLIGHILYLAALIPLCRHLLLCTVIGAVLAALLLGYIFKTMQVKTAFKIFGIFYLGAVIIMTCTAIGILIENPQTYTALYAVGAVLFTLSDIILIFNTFGSQERFSRRIANLSLYYFGQLLIAFSLFFA